jgi:hypothetical protein
MGILVRQFCTVARWTVVKTTVSCRGHPEPRKRHHRRGSKLGLLQVRATPHDLAQWRREASRHDLWLSEFVRAKLNNEPVRVRDVADPALLHELKRHGTNLNQLMHAINAGYFVQPARVEAVLDALHSIYRREIARG